MPGVTEATEANFTAQRRAMIDGQLRTFDVPDQRVLQGFLDVPRELFVPPEVKEFCYSDAVLSLKAAAGETRVMLRPMHLARLIQGGPVRAEDRVLVIGAGRGYSAAVLARLAREVIALESAETLVAESNEAFRSLGAQNVRAVVGPLRAGLPGEAPFDVILIDGGSVEDGIDPLGHQLAPRGRLLCIEAGRDGGAHRIGRAMRYEHVADELSGKALFDASAPALTEFLAERAFVF